MDKKPAGIPMDFSFDAYTALGNSLEMAGLVAAFGQARYAKGFTDGTLLREFCEDYVPEPYFPMADSRPTAERLQWRNP